MGGLLVSESILVARRAACCRLPWGTRLWLPRGDISTPGAREMMRPDKTEYIFRATQFAPGFKMQLTSVHSTEFNILELKVNGKPMF